MSNSAIIFLTLILVITGSAQDPGQRALQQTARKAANGSQTDENQEFQNARTNPVITDRIAALKKFVVDFPVSARKTFALELIASARAELGDQKLRLSDNEAGVNLFKLAVAEAPAPVSEKLFREILINLPTNLLFRGQGAAAFEVAGMIEAKVADNPRQLLGLAGFYLGTESAAEAKRLARMAIALDPTLPPAYQTLGMAHRIDFDLDASVEAYAEALRLDPDSAVSKNSLAELKRATGKPAEAVALYRAVLDVKPDDGAAKTGLILSLFDEGKRSEAETALTESLAANPGNLFLLVGAAYWYAAHNEGARAVELAEKAVAFEPRYTWAHIALARGLISQKKPLEAERTLLIAKQFGNFPTLNYEIATALLAAGFFREADDELKKSFLFRDGKLVTRLGGRIPREGGSFAEILEAERRASIFQPLAAEDPESADKLRALLQLSQSLEETDELKIEAAVDEFIKGDDKMQMHRRLYAAERLLEKRTGAPKVLELTRTAVGEIDSALDVNVPAAAVMADELYEGRTLAASRNEYLIVPEVPRQTLSRILRGRIEELAGWALMQQEKSDEAITRLKRAVTILPENSVWWRSGQWRLGNALDSGGRSKEALDAYLAGYDLENPDPAKRIVVESLYQRVNGSTEGLERIIGVKPAISGQDPGSVEAPDETLNSGETQPVVQPQEISSSRPTRNPPAGPNRIPSNVPIAKESEVSQMVPQAVAKTGNDEAGTVPDIVPPAEAAVSTETSKLPETSAPVPDPGQGDLGSAKPVAGTAVLQPGRDEDRSAVPVKNPLFEPVIITIPNERAAKSREPNESASGKVSKDSAENDASGGENSKGIATPADPESSDDVKPQNPEPSAPTRPRIVAGPVVQIGSETLTAPCRLTINPDSLSLLNDGGSLGVFVGFDGVGDLSKITFASGSAADVSVLPLPDVGVLTDRLFYIIKSISPNVGVYAVTFDSPCGKKELPVTVR